MKRKQELTGAIIEEIIFRREIKKESFQKIATDLNAEFELWPKQALKWSWQLVRNAYLARQELS